jgi:prepilin peptidase CpaA
MLSLAHGAALVTGLLACVTDLRMRRVPNALTFGAAAAGLLWHVVSGGLSGAGFALAGWAVGIIVFLPLYALRGMGAGDVKLLGAFGAWVGPVMVLWVALYGSIAGGVLAVIVALSSGYLRKAGTNIYSLLMFWRISGIRPMPELTLETAMAPRLAYAVPLFAGLAVTVWLER